MEKHITKIFNRKNKEGILTSSTDLNLINRKDGEIWVMNHIFINPDLHDPHEITLLLEQVISFVQEDGKPIWPLDPIAITYFKKHPELNKIWYHQPANF